ncbi:MAG: diguanylate cyclase [Candidatus Viridilinea halotolerans]|uniref:Diguanylate cyclase n=1 Tax=Candidatus Viridilinea halotolerans TaxID=2491704 RepID=A0A426TXY3_9CHLR|nr:MAG: diguanylate cyclase [Candidatus Viridilinea halotolerans]
MRIVIADDEAIARLLLRTMLTAAGHEVLEADDGETAWHILQQEDVALLITDWYMPRLDGISLIQRIRAAANARYIYTILLSAQDSKDDIIAGLNQGADDYLTKPFHPGELHARVMIGARILALETSLREARDGFAYQASHDPLTGLFNRLALSNHVRAELARCQRSQQPLALAVLDVDHFKQFNDRYGHLVGDQVLCHLAKQLTAAIRPYDWLGRWGGEEFLVVLTNTSLAEALIVAERLRLHIADNPLRIAEEVALSVSVSIGVACDAAPEDKEDAAIHLFQQADAALYEAKRLGRNRVHPPL